MAGIIQRQNVNFLSKLIAPIRSWGAYYKKMKSCIRNLKHGNVVIIGSYNISGIFLGHSKFDDSLIIGQRDYSSYGFYDIIIHEWSNDRYRELLDYKKYKRKVGIYHPSNITKIIK